MLQRDHTLTLLTAVRLVQRGWTLGEDQHGRVSLVSRRGTRWRVQKTPRGFEALAITNIIRN